jgi:hypothetical protein
VEVPHGEGLALAILHKSTAQCWPERGGFYPTHALVGFATNSWYSFLQLRITEVWPFCYECNFSCYACYFMWSGTVLTHSLDARSRSYETPGLAGYVAVTQRISKSVSLFRIESLFH